MHWLWILANLMKKIISHAFKQAGNDTKFLLIHIVESAGARILGNYTSDKESEQDEEQLKIYADHIKHLGKQASICLGYGNRSVEISRIVKEGNADLLIMGAHGHSGILDFVYGQTIESVRHKVKIPVLVVN